MTTSSNPTLQPLIAKSTTLTSKFVAPWTRKARHGCLLWYLYLTNFTLRLLNISQINTASDELVQIATTHTADEIAFFKRVLDEMFDTNNTQSAEVMAVTSFQALKLTKNTTVRAGLTQAPEGTQSTAAAGLTIKGAEDCLDAFVAEGWLEKSAYVSLLPMLLDFGC